MHNQIPQPPGPSVSLSRTVFQRLTSELPRDFPCLFVPIPVLFHLARFHAKPPKTRTAPTHARHKSCNRKKSTDSPYVTFNFARSPPPIRAARVSKRYQKIRISNPDQRQSPTKSIPPPLHLPWPLQPLIPPWLFRPPAPVQDAARTETTLARLARIAGTRAASTHSKVAVAAPRPTKLQ